MTSLPFAPSVRVRVRVNWTLVIGVWGIADGVTGGEVVVVDRETEVEEGWEFSECLVCVVTTPYPVVSSPVQIVRTVHWYCCTAVRVVWV